MYTFGTFGDILAKMKRCMFQLQFNKAILSAHAFLRSYSFFMSVLHRCLNVFVRDAMIPVYGIQLILFMLVQKTETHSNRFLLFITSNNKIQNQMQIRTSIVHSIPF